MGSLCSKASSDNFAGAGRPLGSAPAPAGTSSVPKTVKVGGPPRTLGGGPGASPHGESADGLIDARSRAAAAAEARAQAAKPSGKLGAKLEAQKKMSRTEALQAASSDEQRARDIDASASALRHD
ncbi:uncharacterized protein DNG_00276 [Cephalotrichum gorgonifer]|uniref:Uncharacterized protein n=1 Tax=Cephalotrichum gorgonifer TaxID=2041049 RepID=A0AAE8MP37_9PEZI|nr:uncharacterized protein DNG_00276 [Cephalotrichum gorgonifer]